MTRSIAVMVLLETDDPLLNLDTIDLSSPGHTTALRRAVIANLPNLTRVVMVLSEEEARLMCFTHAKVKLELGGTVMRPPAEYIPPTRD